MNVFFDRGIHKYPISLFNQHSAYFVNKVAQFNKSACKNFIYIFPYYDVILQFSGKTNKICF